LAQLIDKFGVIPATGNRMTQNRRKQKGKKDARLITQHNSKAFRFVPFFGDGVLGWDQLGLFFIMGHTGTVKGGSSSGHRADLL
jgi:hypothetical protein